MTTILILFLSLTVLGVGRAQVSQGFSGKLQSYGGWGCSHLKDISGDWFEKTQTAGDKNNSDFISISISLSTERSVCLGHFGYGKGLHSE